MHPRDRFTHSEANQDRLLRQAWKRIACVLGGLTILSPVGASSDSGSGVRPLESPAPAGSASPNVFVRDGRLYLSWLKDEDGGHKLQYARLENETWSDVSTVAEGDHFFANWADVPSVVELDDGTLVGHWLAKSADETYAYDVMMRRSVDGRTWSEPVRPHDDGTHTEHGFVSIVPAGADDALVMWLDGRDYAAKEHEDAEMSLRAATFAADGFTNTAVLDSRTCDCCPTNAVRTGDAILLAYRDRSPEEIRDISLVRYENGRWSQPYALSDDGWQISGCPVNGPSLAARGADVVASWFTIVDQEPMVRLAFSKDTGRTFPVNVRIDEGNALGRSDVLLLDSGHALVVWLESPPDVDAEIRARLVSPDGQLEDPFVVTVTSADRASGFPRLALVRDDVYIAWTEVGDLSQVRMARIDLGSYVKR